MSPFLVSVYLSYIEVQQGKLAPNHLIALRMISIQNISMINQETFNCSSRTANCFFSFLFSSFCFLLSPFSSRILRAVGLVGFDDALFDDVAVKKTGMVVLAKAGFTHANFVVRQKIFEISKQNSGKTNETSQCIEARFCLSLLGEFEKSVVKIGVYKSGLRTI